MIKSKCGKRRGTLFIVERIDMVFDYLLCPFCSWSRLIHSGRYEGGVSSSSGKLASQVKRRLIRIVRSYMAAGILSVEELLSDVQTAPLRVA